METPLSFEIARLTNPFQGSNQDAAERSPPKDFYTASYPLLLKDFATVPAGSWIREEVMRKFSQVYAWMPPCISSYDADAVLVPAGVLNGGKAYLDRLRIAASCFDNSFVTATKFGHVYRPESAATLDGQAQWAAVGPTVAPASHCHQDAALGR